MDYRKIVKHGFSILIDGIKNENKELSKNYAERLKKAGEFFKKFTQKKQMESSNNNDGDDDEDEKPPQKKRKEEKERITQVEDVYGHIPYEIIFNMGFFIPYGKDLLNFMMIDKNFKNFIDTDLFWKLKFKSEFEGYEYPTMLGGPKPKEGWKIATEKYFKESKSWRSFSEEFALTFDTIFKNGNELLLKSVIYWNIRNYKWFDVFMRKYFLMNKKLNDRFLYFMIVEMYLQESDKYGSYTPAETIFRVLVLYKNRIYDKEKIFLGYLKKFLEDREKILFQNFLDELSKNEEYKKLYNDEEFLLKAVKVNGIMLKYLIRLNKDYAMDKNIILKALETNDEPFKYISLFLQDNRDFVLLALEVNPRIFYYLSDDFKNDRGLVIELMKKNKNNWIFSSIFPYIGEELRDDEHIILYSFLQTNWTVSMENAGPTIKNKIEIFYKIINFKKDNVREIEYAGEKVRDDTTFIKHAMTIDKDAIKYATPRVVLEIFKDIKVEDFSEYDTKYLQKLIIKKLK